jgi:hypothetical protein
MSVVETGDPDRIRRRARACAHHARRRAAGRSGGHRGTSLSSGPPASCSIARSTRRASIAGSCTSPTQVKHFKFELRGKRRLHKKPADAEIAACLQWLQRELELVAPQLVIALGASASRALFGRAMPIEKNRGKLTDFAPYGRIMITVHPSFLLRVPDESRARGVRAVRRRFAPRGACAEARRRLRC